MFIKWKLFDSFLYFLRFVSLAFKFFFSYRGVFYPVCSILEGAKHFTAHAPWLLNVIWQNRYFANPVDYHKT